MTETTPLNYAGGRTRWYQRWRGRWALVLAALLGVGAWAAYNAREYAEGAARLWYNYQENERITRLMEYTAPPDQLAWDGTDPDPTRWRRIENDPVARRWNNHGVATVFCHGRETESGRPVALVVEWSEGRSGHGPHLAATYTVPGGVRRWPAAYGPYAVPIDWPHGDARPKRFFAGQPDLNDPTRFTIRVESESGNGTIDARVRDDPSPAYPPFKIVATWQPDMKASPATTRPAD